MQTTQLTKEQKKLITDQVHIDLLMGNILRTTVGSKRIKYVRKVRELLKIPKEVDGTYRHIISIQRGELDE